MLSWRNKQYFWLIIHTVLLTALFLTLFTEKSTLAQGARPQPIIGPRLNPMAVSHSQVQNNHRIYNEYIVKALPLAAQEADIDDQGQKQEAPGRGIHEAVNKAGAGVGLELTQTEHVCNDFNQESLWASSAVQSDIWSESYGGWHPFAFDDGIFYHQENVTFSREQVVGPGNHYGPDQFSFKIAGGQPYAAGIGSPLITVPTQAEVEVSIKYLIFDHDFQGQDYDWVSLGIKPDANAAEAIYVNGYKRGGWFELKQQVQVEKRGKMMILIQAHSPAALNSNVYFDDISIRINGEPVVDCIFAAE